MDPKVSIIIPVYNVEKYLAECMESVIGQTLREIEIVCVNDGSTDSSLQMLKAYAAEDPRIVLIDQQNGGYGAAMNAGIDAASGEYIGIVEPDDFVPSDMFEVLYKTAQENDLDFVKADFYRFKTAPDGRIVRTLNRMSEDPADYNKVFDPSRTPSAQFFAMNTWSGIYRRSFLNEYGIRHNTTPGASFQDTGFWIQTFIYGRRAMIIDKPFYMNRRDNPGSSVYDPNKVYTMNREFDFIDGILKKDPEIRERFKYMFWRNKFLAYTNRLPHIARKYRMDFIRRMREEFLQGNAADELDLTLLSTQDRRLLQALLKSPLCFRIGLFLVSEKMKLRTFLTKILK